MYVEFVLRLTHHVTDIGAYLKVIHSCKSAKCPVNDHSVFFRSEYPNSNGLVTLRLNSSEWNS